MSRDIDILWNSERTLIDAYARVDAGDLERESDEPVSIEKVQEQAQVDELANPAVTKSRLKNGPASQRGFTEILQTVTADLERIEHFWRYAIQQPEGSQQWDDVILPANEREIRRLHTILTRWLAIAEEGNTDRAFDFDYTDEEWAIIKETLEPVVTEDPEELDERLEALTTILLDDDLREILDEIHATPKSRKLPTKDYRNMTWRQAASSTLRNEYGLIENWRSWDHCYELTPRGNAIYETLTRIDEASIFEDYDSEARKKHWVRLAGTGRGLS